MKSDINKFLTYARRSFGEFEYFWFLEFQKRGAPHIHLCWTLPGPSRVQRGIVAGIWAKIAEPIDCPYTAIYSPYKQEKAELGGFTRDNVFRQHCRVKVWEALRSHDGAIRYAVKYATKTNQKRVPENFGDVGRYWGVSRGVRVGDVQEVQATESDVRLALAYLGRNMSSYEVLPKYIFHSGKLT